ncbi:hypothetical protein Gohar_008627, partial [Gossypium harknessii]|nr:hypothetical protein [Gossypium harknessii]
LVLNQRLFTNVEHVKWGIGYDSSCGICGHHSKDILYVLRDCPTTKEIWFYVFLDGINGCFFTGDLLQWEDMSRQQESNFVTHILKNWISLCTDRAGILDGLTLIHYRRYEGVMIQIDSLEAVKTIQHSSLMSSNSALIKHIHLLLANAELWVIQYFPIGLNKVADCLAKMAFDTNHGLKIFKEIPREVLALSSTVQVSDSLAQRTLM